MRVSAKVVWIQFTKCFRQDGPELLKALEEIRYGEWSDKTCELFSSQASIDEEYSIRFQPTRLISTNTEGDSINV